MLKHQFFILFFAVLWPIVIVREPDSIHLRHCLLYEFDKQPENQKNAKLAYDNICEAYGEDVISEDGKNKTLV